MRTIKCSGCGKAMQKGSLKYIVEIRTFADFDGYLEDFEGDIEDGINNLLDQIDGVDEESLERDITKELTLLLCKPCRDKFVKDPLNSGTVEHEVVEAKGTIH
ncbi:MAG: hypothetical protein AABZ23_03085 [Deltaproteobacteria bacterium]